MCCKLPATGKPQLLALAQAHSPQAFPRKVLATECLPVSGCHCQSRCCRPFAAPAPAPQGMGACNHQSMARQSKHSRQACKMPLGLIVSGPRASCCPQCDTFNPSCAPPPGNNVPRHLSQEHLHEQLHQAPADVGLDDIVDAVIVAV